MNARNGIEDYLFKVNSDFVDLTVSS